METENLNFGQALESLAERYRVTLEREAEDPKDAEKRQRRERLLALLGAHRRLLRARAVGVARGGGCPCVPLGARAGGECAARLPRGVRAGHVGSRGERLAAGRLHRERTGRGGAGDALAAGLDLRSLPRADHVPAGRRARARARVRRAGDEARRQAQVPQYVRERPLPQGADRLRRRYGARRGGAGRARGAGRGLHGRHRAASGGRARGRRADGHGADRAAGGRDRPTGPEGVVLPGPGSRRPGVGGEGDRGAARAQQGPLDAWRSSSGSCACRRARTRRTWRRPPAARRCAGCSRRPWRSSASRSSERWSSRTRRPTRCSRPSHRSSARWGRRSCGTSWSRSSRTGSG